MLLLTGPARSGKTRQVLARFREAVESGRDDTLILVPTATLARHLKHELAREGLAFRPQRISTLAGFVRQFTRNTEEIPAELLHLLADEAIRRLDPAPFAAVAATGRFHAVVARTILEFDAAGVDAARLAQAVNRLGIADPLVRAFLEVWAAVEQEIRSRGLVTRGARMKLAAQNIRLRELGEVQTVCLDGFAALPAPELELIAAIAGRVETVVTLPDAPQSPSVKAARAALLAMGATEQILEAEEGTTARAKFIAETAEREADEICRRILVAHAEGTPFRRMAVVMRNRAQYQALLRTTCERFGIPARFYAGTPLLEHPAARFLAALIEAQLTGWDFQATVEALRFCPAIGATTELDWLEYKAREQYPAKGLPELLGLVNRPGKTLQRLLRTAPVMAGAHTPAHWPGRLGELRALCALPEPPVWEARDRVVFQGQAAVLDAFEQGLQDAAALLDPAQRMDLGQFWAAAKLALEEKTLRSRDDRREVVHLLSVEEARQWDVDILFVCGLVDKQFPRKFPQNPFFRDAALRALQTCGAGIRTAEDLGQEEHFLFGAALGAARREAVLSYPRLDGRGQENPESIYFEAIAARTAESRAVHPAPRVHVAPQPAVSRLTHPAVLAMLPNRLPHFSASSLERYLGCPHQFFFERTLRLKELPRLPGDRLSYMEQGTIAHATLARWSMLQTEPVGRFFEEEFDRTCVGERIPDTYATAVTRADIRKALAAFTGKFPLGRARIVETERAFEFFLDEQTKITGRIDVVTEEDGRLVIYDYKFSKKDGVKERKESSVALQPPVYLKAMEHDLGKRPAGVFFVSVKEGEEAVVMGWHESRAGKDVDVLTPEWVDEQMGRVAEAVAEIRAGEIGPHPMDAVTCKRCDFRHACRFTLGAAAAAAAGDAE